MPVTVDASPAPGTGSPAGGSDEDEHDERRRLPRVAIVIAVVLMLAMWGYVVYLAFGPGRHAPIDRLSDPAFAEAGEARCARTLEAVDRLPGASETPRRPTAPA